MRVTTDFWVSALIRRVFSGGGFAAVLRKGAAEAGAVFVILRDRLGQTRLFGPAPQTSYDEAKPQDRLLVELDVQLSEEKATARLERETRFDPDIWVVEIEADAGRLEDLLPIETP
ncbi:MAG: DUF1491 family protein [Rhizobiaceae bacterium]